MKRRDRDLRGSILLLSEKEKEKEIYRPSLMVGQEVEVEEIEIEMDVIYDMISNKIFFFFFNYCYYFLALVLYRCWRLPYQCSCPFGLAKCHVWSLYY